MTNINEIEIYFQTYGVLDEDIEIRHGMFVLCQDADFFVESSIECLTNHPGSKRHRPYYFHLLNYYNEVRRIRGINN